MREEDYSSYDPLLKDMAAAKEIVWLNPDRSPAGEAEIPEALDLPAIREAEARLERFAPLLMQLFPKTERTGGILESDLLEIPHMRDLMRESYGCDIRGKLYLKMDSELPIAGSVKARGGIYEVLKFTEDLALREGILTEEDLKGKDGATLRLALPESREILSRYTIQVGSTGNLGISIGLMSAALGYRAIVHMSADARQWKKELLREHGVTVIEYPSDYSEAVREGRRQAQADPQSHFVDDENSRELFLGYAVAALRLKTQLARMSVPVDKTHPLYVYLPCGVGGAPGGIAWGLRLVFGENVHCFFAEPVQAPCMTLGMLTGLQNRICVQDIGLSGRTEADGLAVSRPSGFVGTLMQPVLSGTFTVRDKRLFDYLRMLVETEGIFIEPSSCAAFQGILMQSSRQMDAYRYAYDLEDIRGNSIHIVWATGGSLVPMAEREAFLKKELL